MKESRLKMVSILVKMEMEGVVRFWLFSKEGVTRIG